ncbi:MAG: histone deacetylase [Candidatus Nezhaarchaeota archaeon]|nr:histone deacetylase [Candidatus Nezhaarchaeota archaeon]MCX8141994.1 histone deacetylase [Candidatus Nezhaarchaeota archaeon]MDW8050225.1 histone deacetylase [Nitrososphaerota archaeon]
MDELSCCLIYDEVFLRHYTGPYHPENPQRLVKIIQALSRGGVLSKVRVEKPEKASISDVLLVHDKDYINYVKRVVESGQGYLDPDTPVSSESFDVALYAVGAAIRGCKMLFDEGYDACFTLQRPPGHHAGRAGAALGAPTLGFCLFNNVAIAAKYLVEKYDLERVAIFDFDCHHGNGTQEIFYSDSSVLYISTHQDGRTAYPGTGFIDEIGEGEGRGFNINIPLPPFLGDDLYEEVLNSVVEKVLRKSSPKALLLSSGFDAHREDPITSMNLSVNSFTKIADMVKRLKTEKVIEKILFVLEGGYGPGLVDGVYNILASLTGSQNIVIEEKTVSSSIVRQKVLRVIEDVREKILKPYWGLE